MENKTYYSAVLEIVGEGPDSVHHSGPHVYYNPPVFAHGLHCC